MSNNIAILRRQCDLSQKDLGNLLGVAQTTVSGWESGRSQPDNDMLAKMSKLFPASIGYILGMENHKPYNGLSREEYYKATDAAYMEASNERAIEAHLELESLHERKYDEIRWQEEYAEHKLGLYFEVFLMNKACDHMTKEERTRLLDIAKAAFPQAFSKI